MIKIGEKKVTLSATRDLTDEANPGEVSIIMDDESLVLQVDQNIIALGINVNITAENAKE